MQVLFKYKQLEEVEKLIVEWFKPLGVEEVPVEESTGRILAEDIVAPHDVPGEDVSHVDGYAISECSGTVYKLVEHDELKPCEAKYVNTGEPVPRNTTAVAPREAVRLVGEGYVDVLKKYERGHEVIWRGSDVRQGEVLAKKGSTILPVTTRILVELGFEKVKVYKKPRVLVVPVGSEFAEGLKKESSSIVVKSMCEAVGAQVSLHEPVEDSVNAVKHVLAEGLEQYDVVVTIGGVSLGSRDYTLTAATSLPGSALLARGIAVQPGRTTTLLATSSKPLVLLPGLIQSTISGGVFVLQPILKRLQGSSTLKSHYLLGYYKLAEDYEYRGRFAAFTRLRFARLVSEGELEVVIEEAPSPIQSIVHKSHGFVLLERGVVRIQRGALIKLYRAPGLY